MAHDIGHFVLDHPYENVLVTTLLSLRFPLVRGGFSGSVRRWGARWGVRDIADPAGLPVLVLWLAVWSFVFTPVTNSFIRSNEAEADLSGLNAARRPDGFATVSLTQGEYRKPGPGPLEELLLFDRPSGRSGILMAMTWKAYHE